MTYKHFRLIYNAKFHYNNHFQKLMEVQGAKTLVVNGTQTKALISFPLKRPLKKRPYKGRST